MQFGGGKGKDQWEADKLLALCRELQPHILIDNRTGIEQDIWTPEQFQPTEWIRSGHDGELVNWEACQTFSGSWGYYRDEASWKSPKMLLNLLIDSVSCGGNLIMNVGPTGRGNFDPRAEEALRVFSKWMHLHNRAIYGCTMAEPEFTAPAGCKLTQSEDGKRLYVHLQNYPFRLLKMEHLAGKIAYAQFLNDASEILYEERNADFNFNDHVQVSEGAGTVTFHLPPVAPDVIVPVIEIFLK
jgi:alpha-L-fucosidase